MRFSHRRGVSAVISALLMVAIAVSLSAALFVSTSGYLSGLTNNIGSNQPGQNKAAQSILTIENYVAKTYTTGFAANPTNGYVELFVRNVGAVSLTLGSVTITAPPTNGGQSKSFLAAFSSSSSTWSSPYSDVYVCSEATSSVTCEVTSPCTSATSTGTLTSQSNTAEVWVEWCPGASPKPISGDAFQIQVTSTYGASNIITINMP